jgi:hypothetical protein
MGISVGVGVGVRVFVGVGVDVDVGGAGVTVRPWFAKVQFASSTARMIEIATDRIFMNFSGRAARASIQLIRKVFL